MNTSDSDSSAVSEASDTAASVEVLNTSISNKARQPFHFPEVGDEVVFTRSPSHETETGYVMSREYGTRCIEIVDVNAKPLRLRPGQYRSAAR
tara:strand:- start:2707 stop:2985 length:279 start_codon:yes stop_codon:yes gene_type:complete